MTSPLGNLYVIAAPSGTGKTTLVKALLEVIPGITVSISHTTRQKRPAEKDGVNYYFIDEKKFQEMVKNNEFLEHATVFNNLYGTSKKWVAETLQKGLDVILEIDWQGAQQIKKLFPHCINIFILPPSLAVLAERLHKRNQDTPEIIQQRLADVRNATAHIKEFDYIVMNNDFEHAVQDLKTLVEAGRLSEKCQARRFKDLLEELSHMDSI